MKTIKLMFGELRQFSLLWSTQSLSALGTSMTAFALVIWSYKQEGSALVTALLSVCSYAPYVAMSIFAGALSDRWDKKRTMLACDFFAALCTLGIFALFLSGNLRIWHLYLLNALSGLMNTLQQPASEVAATLLTPHEHIQRISALNALSNSLVTVLTPALATAVMAFAGLSAVIAFDIATCAIAIFVLWRFIKIPEPETKAQSEPVLKAAAHGLKWLGRNRGILDLILFLAAINFIASIISAAMPAMILSREGGSETVLGMVNTISGLAMLAGSLAASAMPKPKSRVRAICNSLLLSMSTENFLMAFGRIPGVWYIGELLGWIAIPIMNTNLNSIMRETIPVEVQGRVYSTRNTLQFFTIPLGYMLGGILVDNVCEPFMARHTGIFTRLLGVGKGSGAALVFLICAFAGVLVCIIFRKDRHIWDLERNKDQ